MLIRFRLRTKSEFLLRNDHDNAYIFVRFNRWTTKRAENNLKEDDKYTFLQTRIVFRATVLPKHVRNCFRDQNVSSQLTRARPHLSYHFRIEWDTRCQSLRAGRSTDGRSLDNGAWPTGSSEASANEHGSCFHLPPCLPRQEQYGSAQDGLLRGHPGLLASRQRHTRRRSSMAPVWQCAMAYETSLTLWADTSFIIPQAFCGSHRPMQTAWLLDPALKGYCSAISRNAFRPSDLLHDKSQEASVEFIARISSNYRMVGPSGLLCWKKGEGQPRNALIGSSLTQPVLFFASFVIGRGKLQHSFCLILQDCLAPSFKNLT
ncbi:hypothetical protein O181_002202 [Austropuccinia psidii MF-1]|uniref:Uncharacterized protein n=1 Tax=Austropuccinia psidii MF-1 TaxID=1389203 RepID=A0A9Q3BC10_9BASI|nr:hypothetical protein [Austropuccinia psidii MF-1]